MSGRLRYEQHRHKRYSPTLIGAVEEPRRVPSNIIARPIKLPPMEKVKGS